MIDKRVLTMSLLLKEEIAYKIHFFIKKNKQNLLKPIGPTKTNTNKTVLLCPFVKDMQPAQPRRRETYAQIEASFPKFISIFF